MRTSPTPPASISYDFGHSFQPIPAGLWKFFGKKAEAEALLPKVQALAPNAQIADWTEFFGQPIILNSENPEHIAIWVFIGDTPDNLHLEEFSGWLVDRETYPNPFVDSNGSHSKPGGPNLMCRNLDGFDGELHWSL